MKTEKRITGRNHDAFQRSGASAERRKSEFLQTAVLCRGAAKILVAGILALSTSVAWAQGWTVSSNLTLKADLALKETYDSNVYLQDTAPTNTAPGALPAKKDSWVTTFTPRVGLNYKPCAHFGFEASYAPDMVVYHNAHSEDYFAHRFGLTLSGKAENVIWEQINAFTWIDGNNLGPLFATPQDVPAIGGIPLRDRRDAFIYRGGLKLTWTLGKFFIRPVASAYEHDFHTDQFLRTQVPTNLFYVNYIDRQDVNGGLDLGYKVAEKTSLVVGYRYGRQDQYRGPSVFDSTRFADSPYDSAYHRILMGVEGSPAPWLKLAVLGGPEIRDWQHDVMPPGFDRNELIYWIDASVSLLPTKNDTIVLLNRRYEQPAFTSQSVYEDITYSVAWKHTFDSHWAANAGFQLYIGDWQSPVQREDWIYTPSASLSYTHDKHLGGELAYSYDWVENQVPTSISTYAEGREYTRHLVSLSVKYTF